LEDAVTGPIQIKTCSKCKAAKSVDEFCAYNASPDGRQYRCRACERDYRIANKVKIAARLRDWRSKSKTKIAEYRSANKARIAERERKYRTANKEKIASDRAKNKARMTDYHRAYYAANKAKVDERIRSYRAANPEKARRASIAWSIANPEKRLKAARARRAANPKKARDATRAWGIANPEKVRASAALRRARKRAAAVGNRADNAAVRAFYREVAKAERLACFWCKKSVPKDLRHVDHIIPLARGGSHTRENLCCACKRCNLTKGAKLQNPVTGEALLL